MPASLLADMNTHSGVGLEDQRALQIALELTKLGLDDNDNAPGPSAAALSTYTANMTSNERKSANMTECVPVPSSEHVAEIVGRQGCKIKALRAKTNTYIKTPVRGEEPVFLVTGRREDVEAAKREILSAAEHFSQIRASRRNNNPSGPSGSLPGPPTPNTPGQVTIQVRVPYRVVGLVVGPKGATIKRIQQQTRTYIVTPNRDKEPIFEVTGLPDNVDKARQEIESHIAMRTGGMLDSAANMNGGGVVGVLGPVLGGNMNGHDEHRHNDFHTNGIDAGFHEISNDLLNSIYKPPSTNSAFTSYTSALNQSNNVLSQQQQQQRHRHGGQDNIFTFPPLTNGVTKLAEMTGLTNGFNTPPSFGLYDSDEGIGGSPSFDHNPIPMPNASIWSEITNGDHCITESGSFTNMFAPISGSGGLSKRSNSSVNVCTVSSASLSPPLTADSTLSSSSSSIATTLSSDHSSVRRICSDPLSSGGAITGTGEMMMTTTAACYHPSSAHALVTSTSLGSAHSLRSSSSSSPTDSTGSLGRRRHCMVCGDNDIVAALVPCGHNLFCMECANLIFDKPVCQRHCPVCQQAPTQAIRIFS